jgi:hypothetical protein
MADSLCRRPSKETDMAQIRLDRDEVTKRQMPGICMRCDERASVYKEKKFSWFPPWIGVMLLVAWPVYLILMAVMTKRMTVSVPLCEKHKHHWLVRTVVGLVGLGLLLILLVFNIVITGMVSNAGDDDVTGPLLAVLWIGLGILFLAWLITLVAMQNTAIRPNEITDETITLTGVSEAFVDAVEDARDQEEEEDSRPRPRARRQRSDRVYDPNPPRRRPPPRDAYRESDE